MLGWKMSWLESEGKGTGNEKKYAELGGRNGEIYVDQAGLCGVITGG